MEQFNDMPITDPAQWLGSSRALCYQGKPASDKLMWELFWPNIMLIKPPDWVSECKTQQQVSRMAA